MERDYSGNKMTDTSRRMESDQIGSFLNTVKPPGCTLKGYGFLIHICQASNKNRIKVLRLLFSALIPKSECL